ncbi:MAG TPA: TonB-dependent receptor [Sphingobium sp.]|uniref:TonB-dependent receptor n=1 Tax=Sphingobium sp. TaxID=1912891 RepID=UPI002ED3F901
MSISSHKAGVRASLALSCVGSALLPLAATPLHAQSTAAQGEGRTLGGVTVTSTAIDDDGIQVRQQASPKAVRPIRDTPQTITVLSSQVMQEQNLLSLKDALSTVPGITFGAGEAGSGYGDSIQLRGYSANNDITIDGVRDSAQYSRSDNFNIEQIEVTNGANSVTNGSGSVGGNINLVTKRPLDTDRAIFQGGIGTDNYYRTTADINKHLTDNIAFRLNAMYHHNDVPGREVEQNDRWGVAPSITLGMGGPTKMTFQYFHQEEVNTPQFGVPYFSNASLNGPIPGVDRSNYYGYRNIDTQRIKVNQVSAIFEHEFSDTVSIRNLFRYQDVKQFTRVDGPEGNFCLAKDTALGVLGTGVACTATNTVSNGVMTVYGQRPGYFSPTGGSRGATRDTDNQLTYNQTDLKAVFKTAGLEHTLDFGLSFSRENYKLASGNSIRYADGTVYVPPLYDIYNPNGITGVNDGVVVYGNNVYTGPLNFIVSNRTRARMYNYAAYLFDAIKFSDHFEINGGMRWEHVQGRTQSDTIGTSGATLGQVTAANAPFYNRANLFSYRVGLVYKPIETVTLYAAYGNSKTPSQSTVNSAGACTAATCNVKPEGAKNYEVGVKAELFNGGLLATLAAFRNERDSYRVASGDPTIADQQLDGYSRVNGIAVGLSGHINPNWSITANYTYLKSKLIRSVSEYCAAHPGVITTNTATPPVSTNVCGNSATFPDPAAGSELTQTPKHSGSIYTAYTLPFGLTIGYGATYQGSFALNLPVLNTPLSPATSGITSVYRTKDYLLHNATISYNVNDALSVQVNIKNIGDKVYYTRIRSTGVNGAGWATIGDGRSALVTLTYKM